MLLAQSRAPARLIVIDSSDDHAPVESTIRGVTKNWPGRVIIRHSEPGLPFQRNLGLGHVTAPIVLFPDDDSLLLQGAAEAILQVYEHDPDGQIAAVCAGEAMEPPNNLDLRNTDWVTPAHRREAGMRRARNQLEKRFSAIKPQMYLGQVFASRPVPEWFFEMDVVPVEYMTGFRMSFRTEAIRPTGFDAALGGYALDEDIDASFVAARSGLVVAARKARIYHHRFPSGRGDGGRMGRMEILNRIYIGLKHAKRDDLPAGTEGAMRRRLFGFVALKLLTGLLGLRSEYGRARLRGAFRAVRASGPIWRASGVDLAEAYHDALAKAEAS